MKPCIHINDEQFNAYDEDDYIDGARVFLDLEGEKVRGILRKMKIVGAGSHGIGEYAFGYYTQSGTGELFKTYIELDCDDEPAFEDQDKKEWWSHGKLHREEGPAVEWADDVFEWWTNGELQKTEEYHTDEVAA